MLYSFRSKAGGEVLMLDHHARPLLEAAGKTADTARDPRGVFTTEQLGGAIQALQAHIAQQAQQESNQDKNDRKDKPHEDDEEKNASQPVSASQRAYPLLDLLRKAEAAGADVMWETSGA